MLNRISGYSVWASPDTKKEVIEMNPKTVSTIKKELIQRRDVLMSLQKKNSQADIDIVEVSNKDLVDLSDVEGSWFTKERMSFHLKQELSQVANALVRMEQGTFGRCEECDAEIPIKRLRVRPDATLCLACQETAERDMSRSSTQFLQ